MQHAHDEYLATQVLTATPDKLRLMLIEAALRRCDVAKQCWKDADDEQAAEAIYRAQDIVTELLASLNHDAQPQLAKKIAAIYNFIFRELVSAQIDRDESRLENARRVLEIERDTWRQVTQKLAETGEVPPARAVHAPHAVPAPIAPVASTPPTRLSLEA